VANNITSSLIVRLIDQVTAPARSISKSILGIQDAMRPGAGAAGFSDRLTAAIDRNNAAMDAARGRMFDSLAAGYALKTALTAPINAAANFESAMADVRKVVDFATEGEFTAFRNELLALSRQLPVSVEGLAQIAAAAGQAGIAQKDIIAFTEAAAKVGVAFDISADQAGDAMAKMMTGLGMTLPEVISLSDAMNHLSNAQASSAAEILDVVRRVGAMGKQYGFTAEQTAAFGSAMIASGAQTEVAATSFMNMGRALTRGASATNRQKAALGQLGLEAGDVAKRMQTDAVGTTIQVMEAISKLPKEMQAAVSSDLFGDEARALGPLLTNLPLLRESLGLVGDESKYAGSAFKEFAARSATFQNRMQTFRNVMSALSITIGNALLPVLTDMMARIEPIIDMISKWIERNPDLTAGIISATAAIIGLRVALSALSFMGLMGRGGALSLLAAGMNTVGAAALRLGGAARSAIALQTALGAMAGGQTLGTLSKLGIGLKAAVMAVPGMGALGSALSAIGAAIATISAPVWGLFAAIAVAVAAAGVAIYKYWDRITATLSGVGQAIGEILAPAFEAIRPVLDWFAPLGDAIAAGWEKAGEVIGRVGEWLGSIFAKEVLSEDQKAQAKQSGYDFVMNLWNGMKQVMADLLAWVGNKASEILAPFKAMGETIKSYLPGGTVTAANNPAGEFEGLAGANAKGGPMSPGRTYLVGEQGPELVTPTRSGYVHPNGSGGGSTSIGGVTVHAPMHFHGVSAADAEELFQRFSRRLSQELGNALRGSMSDPIAN
jgi:TP901 family phage tail tape measure protein